MSEPRSKCCGDTIGYIFAYFDSENLAYKQIRNEEGHIKICEGCDKPCEVEEKEEEGK